MYILNYTQFYSLQYILGQNSIQKSLKEILREIFLDVNARL